MEKTFQIRSKHDAVLLTEKLLGNGGDFSYHVPLLGGMEGGYVDIRCDKESASFTVRPSTHENDGQQKKGVPELMEHLWEDRKFVNAELRKSRDGFREPE